MTPNVVNISFVGIFCTFPTKTTGFSGSIIKYLMLGFSPTVIPLKKQKCFKDLKIHCTVSATSQTAWCW
jgi:hypothetical protein